MTREQTDLIASVSGDTPEIASVFDHAGTMFDREPAPLLFDIAIER